MEYLQIAFLLAVIARGHCYNPDTFEACDISEDCSSDQTSGCATIFQHRNHGGWKQCVPLAENECVTLGSWWTAGGGRLSSLDTHTTCIRLHDESDCEGFSYVIVPNSDSNHQDLSSMGWEDQVKSISSCDRIPSPKCTVKYLFGPKVVHKSVSDRAEQIGEAVLAAIGGSVGGFFPTFNVLFNVLQVVKTIESGGDPYSALIDAKVDEAVAKNAAVQLQAKMGTVEKWLKTMILTNNTGSNADNYIELLITMNTCEEIFLLLKDSNYAFSSNKVLSSPYLIGFSNMYYGLATVLYQKRKDLRSIVKQDVANLAKLNQEYLTQAKIQRSNQLEAKNVGSCGSYSQAHGLPCGPVISDGLISKNYELCELLSNTDDNCMPTGDLPTYQRCLTAIHESIDIQMNAFFSPTINRLLNFPNGL